jgi:WD40 repeat protein/tRNA A-37 threonylcarbamoyl transferase component Bud32
MGQVFLAEQDHPHRRVALKVVRPDVFSPSLRKRFQFEVDVLGKLQHPGIAQIHEAGQIDREGRPLPYFAMEYVEGIELRRYSKQQGLGIRERLELVARICDAVHHAHANGIVHRDLKPENVLVVESSSATSEEGTDEFARLGQPKVLDFGVARATDADIQMTTQHTDVGKLVGTLSYMSPEQVIGDSRRLDTRSDIYAIGTLLYELLSGRLPFDLRNKPIPEAARIIREEEPTRLGSIRTVFRGDIDTIVCKALEKDRDRRYASTAELAADIRRYLSSEPITAHPPSTLYQLKKFARRNKGLVTGLALAFLILVVGIISSLTFAVRASRGEEEAHRAAYRLGLTAADAVGATDPLQALRHLEAVPPEFRGWEWRHLRARFTPQLKKYVVPARITERHRRSFFYSHLRVTACRPDGSLLAARMGSGGIELFDPESGKVVGTFGTAEDLLVPVLSPDGSHLATISRTKEKLIVWNTRTGRSLFEMPIDSGNIGDLCFSPDSSLILLASTENTSLIETATGHCRFRTAPFPTNSRQAVFSPDGARFALQGANWGDERCGGDEFFVCVYTTSGDCLAHRKMLSGNCSMAFSPDGSRLSIGQLQRKISILDATTLDVIEVLQGHTDLVSALAFSPSGGQLASASRDGTVRIWNLYRKSTSCAFASLPRGFGITSLTYSRDGEMLAAGNYFGVLLWDLQRNACSVLKGHESYVYRVTFDPAGALLASGGWDKTVRLWDPLTGEELADLPASDARYKLHFTPDGTRLIGTEIWDSATVSRLTAPRRKVDDALFEPQEAKVPKALRYLHHAAGGAKVASLGECYALSWNRSLAAQGLPSGEVRIFRCDTGEVFDTLRRDDVGVCSVAFSPDDRKIISGDANGRVTVWDLHSGSEVARLEGHTGSVYTVNWSPDGSRIVSGGNDCAIILWDARTHEQVFVLHGHTSYVHSVCFSPDGTMLASGSGDGTVRIWDSVPSAERWNQIRRERAMQHEAEPMVDRLLAELEDGLDVADRLRADGDLTDESRGAALRVLLRSLASPDEAGP